MKREPDIGTGTLRSHPWQDHSTRVAPNLSLRAPRAHLLRQRLAAGVRVSELFQIYGADLQGQTTFALANALACVDGPWGEPLELPEPDSGVNELG